MKHGLKSTNNCKKVCNLLTNVMSYENKVTFWFKVGVYK